MPVTPLDQFKQFFRKAADLDVDKEDLRRYLDFIDTNLYDFLTRAQEVAREAGRRVITPLDLPLTKGLLACIGGFRSMDEEIELLPVLDRLAKFPELDLDYTTETKAYLPLIVGGLSWALARSFTIIDPDLTSAETNHWERSFALFNLLI